MIAYFYAIALANVVICEVTRMRDERAIGGGDDSVCVDDKEADE